MSAMLKQRNKEFSELSNDDFRFHEGTEPRKMG
jgi:hypothetical protein